MSFLDHVSEAVGATMNDPGNPGQQSNTHNNDVNAQLLAMLQGSGGQQQPTEKTPEEELMELMTPTDKDHKDQVFDPNALFADVDPVKLKESFNNINYVEGLFTPEVAEKIAAGGQDAVMAMAQVMNQMAQKVAFDNLQMSARLTTTGLGKASAAWNQSASTTLRDSNIKSAIQETDPMFANPIMAPMVDNLHRMIVSKHPNATKEEVKGLATKMLTVVRGNQQQQQPNNPGQQENQPFDFDAWFAGGMK